MLVTTLNKSSKFTTYCLTPAREVGVVSSCMLWDSCEIRIYCFCSTAPKTTIPIQRRSVRRKDFAELVIVHFLCKIYRELNYPSLSLCGRYTLIMIDYIYIYRYICKSYDDHALSELKHSNCTLKIINYHYIKTCWNLIRVEKLE